MASDVREQKHLNEEYFNTNLSLINELFDSPVPKEELSRNLFLYQDRRALSRFLFLNDLYLKSMQLHGSIFEFGARYGVNTSIFTSLRGIHEPFNHNRKIVSFDTFSGFPTVDKGKDSVGAKIGDFGVPNFYEEHLEKILTIHEKLAPLEQIKKFELVKGDVTKTLGPYLENRQETIISLAYFDFDLYRPTIASLNAIEPFLSPNAIIAFDEINVLEWPGETKALREWVGNRNMQINHSNYRAAAGYLVYNR